ncbi:hypothetical protein Tco_0739490, partial [Tanacetum coccineum]
RADNRPPMLDKSRYNSWQSHMILYNKGLRPDVYSLVNHHIVAKDIRDRVKLVIEGSELSLQESESKLYDEFDTFTSEKGETPEWSKFVTDVKLAKDMHNTNFDHLYAYLRQHEAHANEVRLMRHRFPDPLALVSNTYNSPPRYTNESQYHQQLSLIAQQYYSPPTQQQFYQALRYAGSGVRGNAAGTRVNRNVETITANQEKVVRCYNYQGEGHMARHCTKPKRPKNSEGFKEKMCVRNAEQPPFINDLDIDITSDSNDISYDQYLKETENEVAQDTISFAQQDAMIMSVIEEMSNQVAKCNEVNNVNNTVNESLTAELERYKLQIKCFEERQKVG